MWPPTRRTSAWLMRASENQRGSGRPARDRGRGLRRRAHRVAGRRADRRLAGAQAPRLMWPPTRRTSGPADAAGHLVRTGGAEPSGAPGAAGTEQCAGTARRCRRRYRAPPSPISLAARRCHRTRRCRRPFGPHWRRRTLRCPRRRRDRTVRRHRHGVADGRSRRWIATRTSPTRVARGQGRVVSGVLSRRPRTTPRRCGGDVFGAEPPRRCRGRQISSLDSDAYQSHAGRSRSRAGGVRGAQPSNSAPPPGWPRPRRQAVVVGAPLIPRASQTQAFRIGMSSAARCSTFQLSSSRRRTRHRHLAGHVRGDRPSSLAHH